MPFTDSHLNALITAIVFATDKHQNQRRKGGDMPPYINHPIHLLNLLWEVGEMRDMDTLVAARMWTGRQRLLPGCGVRMWR